MSLTAFVRNWLDQLDKYRPELEAAMEHNGGTHTFDDLTAMVLQGQLRLWHTEKSIALTEVIEYPRQKHYHVFAAGGDLDDIVATIPKNPYPISFIICHISETKKILPPFFCLLIS